MEAEETPESHWSILQTIADEIWHQAHENIADGDNPRERFKQMLGRRFDHDPEVRGHWMALVRAQFLNVFAGRCATLTRRSAVAALAVAISKNGTPYVPPNHALLRQRFDVTRDTQKRLAEIYAWSLPSGKTLGQATLADLLVAASQFGASEHAHSVNRVYLELVAKTLKHAAPDNEQAIVRQHIDASQLTRLRLKAERLVAEHTVKIAAGQ